MNKAGFTHHFCLGEIMTGTTLPEQFVEQVLNCKKEIACQMDFEFTEGQAAIMFPNDKAQPAEGPEIYFIKSASDYAYEVMHDLIKCLPVETVIFSGHQLIMLKHAIESEIEHYMETDGDTEAYRIAADWKHERDCIAADMKYDEMRDRRDMED